MAAKAHGRMLWRSGLLTREGDVSGSNYKPMLGFGSGRPPVLMPKDGSDQQWGIPAVMISPCPYSQWDFESLEIHQCTPSYGVGYVQAIGTPNAGPGSFRVRIRMLYDGKPKISFLRQSSLQNNSAGASTKIFWGAYPPWGLPAQEEIYGTVWLTDNTPTGMLYVPYYRYSIEVNLVVWGTTMIRMNINLQT